MRTNKTYKKVHGIGTLLSLTLLVSVLGLSFCFAQQKAEQTVFTTKYLVSLPEGYSKIEDKKWPLLVYLHDGNLNSQTLEELKESDFIKNIDSLTPPFIIVSPLRDGSQWNMGTLNLLLDEVIKKHYANQDRVYLVGHDVWDWVFADPERFAALAVLSGCPKKRHWSDAWRLRNLPILILDRYYGGDSCNQEIAKLIQEYNGKVEFVPKLNGQNIMIAYEWLYRWLTGKNRPANVPTLVVPKVELLREYEGSYTFDGETYTITLDKNRLIISKGKGGSRGLVAESNTTFLFANSHYAGLTFTRDAQGRVNGFEILPNSHKKGVKLN